MTSIENRNICLELNSGWQPIGNKLVRAVIADLCANVKQDGKYPLAIDFDYELNEDGTPDYTKPTKIEPCNWEEWCELPIRDWDITINTAKKTLRVPTVIIYRSFSEMPVIKAKDTPTKTDIYNRDKGVCQYSGRQLTRKGSNIEHVHSKSKGGKNAWTNLICCDINLNTQKGNKSLKESGMVLIKNPEKPKSIPISHTIREINHPSWAMFLKNKLAV
jgi:5-methylcytosine-specific restriction endonuclease McrA